jgi:hypothetical protein
LRSLRSNRDLTGSSPSPACMERKLDDPLNEIVSRSKGHAPASASGHSIADARLRSNARGRNGGVRQELAAGVDCHNPNAPHPPRGPSLCSGGGRFPVSVLLPTLNNRSRQARVKPPKCDGRHILTTGDVKSSQLRRHGRPRSPPDPPGLSKFAEGR